MRRIFLFFITFLCCIAYYGIKKCDYSESRKPMKFSDVARSFDAIEPISSRLGITRLLAELFKEASAHEAQIITYLSLGELHPSHISTQFNIAEKTMVKVVADVLGKSNDTILKEMKSSGDLGLVLASYEWSGDKELSLLHVYDTLLKIEEMGGVGSQEERIDKLAKLLRSLDPLSAKFVARIVLGKLRLGFSDMTIIDALSWMETGDKSLRQIIEDAYNLCADLGFIAQTLKEGGIEAVKKVHIQVGTPVLPAAAERLPSAHAIFEKLDSCWAEPKIDGFRLQIHIDKNHHKHAIRFFSRNLQDMSAMFPDLAKELLKINAKELICEGEAIGYDPDTGGFLPFQETTKRRRKHGIEKAAEEFPLKLFLFDLLFYDGYDYLNVPYVQRHKQLEELIKPLHSDTVLLIEHKKIESAKELHSYFLEQISEGLEGVMVKRPNAMYQAGKRNFNWIKLKRSSSGHLEDTIDCVVLGYYTGKGKRAKFGVGAFLVGIYNKSKDVFQTVAKIGTGMSDEEWKDLKKRCEKVHSAHKPKNVECAKELTPDEWVVPEVVCSVKADEITLSPMHTAGKVGEKPGYALRFPRFINYRPDKDPEEATTDKEVVRLYEDQFKK
jgi:DNA ligase 1